MSLDCGIRHVRASGTMNRLRYGAPQGGRAEAGIIGRNLPAVVPSARMPATLATAAAIPRDARRTLGGHSPDFATSNLPPVAVAAPTAIRSHVWEQGVDPAGGMRFSCRILRQRYLPWVSPRELLATCLSMGSTVQNEESIGAYWLTRRRSHYNSPLACTGAPS